jgi:hypothetical protein
VIYLYLDNLSNAIARWTTTGRRDDFEPPAGEIKHAAE